MGTVKIIMSALGKSSQRFLDSEFLERTRKQKRCILCNGFTHGNANLKTWERLYNGAPFNVTPTPRFSYMLISPSGLAVWAKIPVAAS